MKNAAAGMRTTVLAIVVAIIAVSAAADDLRVMSAGAVEPGLVKLIEQFKQETGHTVQVQFGSAPQLTTRLAAGQAGDVLIAPTAVMDQAVTARNVHAPTRTAVGRVGVGVAVRRGASVPDVSTVDRLKSALLAADAVIFTRGSSGQYVERMLAKIGVADGIASKIVRADDGEGLIARLVEGKGNDIGLGAITEIRQFEPKGVMLVAPLVDAVQNFTVYEAAVLTGARTPQSAARFVRFITTPEARTVLAAVGVQAP
jgi:molybdate transport system substrate-binding protein